MAIMGIREVNQSLLSTLTSLNRSSSSGGASFSVENVLLAAQQNYATNKANQERISDQLSAVSTLTEQVSKLRTAANDLNVNGKVLNLFSDGSDNATIQSGIEEFVEAFNDLRSFASTNRDFFQEDFNRTVGNFLDRVESELSAVGVTSSSDGTLSIDEDALSDALTNDFSAVKEAFGGLNGLATRVNGFAESVSRTGTYQLLSNIEVPQQRSRAVELMQDDLFRTSILSLIK